jgi:electron transfer flavoprotein alpha subunit
MSILVLCEQEGGVFKKTAAELLGLAASLSAGPVAAAVLGGGDAASLGAFGATTAYVVAGDFGAYDGDAVTGALAAIVATANPTLILAPASYAGRDALPRLAARLGAGLAADCTGLSYSGGAFVAKRPVYAGKALVDVRFAKGPAIVTVRANSFPQPAATGAAATVTTVPYAGSAPRVTVSERLTPSTAVVDLTEADRIVTGGRSLGSKEKFDEVVRPLAAALKATPGASRAAVDAGFAGHGDQVGQTGKVVNPTIYLALGVSGAIQHLAGMRTSKVIVAVNKDAAAPIFEHAAYGIVGDLFEVAPKLQKAIAALD